MEIFIVWAIIVVAVVLYFQGEKRTEQMDALLKQLAKLENIKNINICIDDKVGALAKSKNQPPEVEKT